MLGNVDAERKLLELTYDGTMTVTGTTKKNVDGETVVEHDTVILDSVPCALSFADTPDSQQNDNSGQVSYQATVFCAPELSIPAGCRLTVAQYGAVYALKYSGEAITYPTHKQLSATRESEP